MNYGADSETGTLRDVLLCPPDNFRWGATSVISKATLESGRPFEPEAARAQHASLVAAYEGAGVNCHFLEPDPVLPYQVFARDSSVMTPWGAFVTSPKQYWRRGEYAPVIRFYQENEIPLWQMATAGAIEGGDVMIVEPGCVVIGNGEDRTERPAAKQLAAFFEAEGWEARVEPIPGIFVHIDVLMAVVAPKLAAVCTDIVLRQPRPLAGGQGLRDPAGAGGGRVRARRERDVAWRWQGPDGSGRAFAERADGGARARAACSGP